LSPHTAPPPLDDDDSAALELELESTSVVTSDELSGDVDVSALVDIVVVLVIVMSPLVSPSEEDDPVTTVAPSSAHADSNDASARLSRKEGRGIGRD
jgi:hypothetical protein